MLVILIAIGLVVADKKLPNQYLLWRSLDVEAPVGFATDTQLMRVSLSPSKTCMKLADEAFTLLSTQADPRDAKGVCGWKVAYDVKGSSNGVLVGEAPMQCPLTLGVYIWLREVDGIAREQLGSPLKYVHHFGTYSCRRQNGNNSGQWSEHAFANAWDISAFELEDGQKISVLKHWTNGTKNQRKFLRSAREQACKVFRVTLSPDYNAAHKDHFHVDMGPTKTCR